MKTLVILTNIENVGPNKHTKLNVFGVSSSGYWKLSHNDSKEMILVVKDGNKYTAYDCTIINKTQRDDERYEIEFTWKSNTVELDSNFSSKFGQHPSQWHDVNKCEIFC
jgi:hypothetical protein